MVVGARDCNRRSLDGEVRIGRLCLCRAAREAVGTRAQVVYRARRADLDDLRIFYATVVVQFELALRTDNHTVFVGENQPTIDVNASGEPRLDAARSHAGPQRTGVRKSRRCESEFDQVR